MNKPSERIVVFVSTAQKRAISATADELGISVSELMRRAVLSFGATSEQVKAASIVDRLRAPREPDALNEALQRVARSTKRASKAEQPALKLTGAAQASDQLAFDTAHESVAAQPPGLAPLPAADPVSAWSAVAAVDGADPDAEVAAQAAARVAAAKAAVLKANAGADTRDDSGSCIDPAEGNGRFA
ncbi:MAG TPA: hypothetical protein VGL08_21980 [Paraburkholderia sp.]|jgi:hypothetical protein